MLKHLFIVIATFSGIRSVRLDRSLGRADVTYDPLFIASARIRSDIEEIAPSPDHSNRVEVLQVAVC